jgi:hypothetical protein
MGGGHGKRNPREPPTRPIRALVWNDLDSVSRVRGEYRCHSKAGLIGSGPSALLLAKDRGAIALPG